MTAASWHWQAVPRFNAYLVISRKTGNVIQRESFSIWPRFQTSQSRYRKRNLGNEHMNCCRVRGDSGSSWVMLKNESRHWIRIEEPKTGRRKRKVDGWVVILGNRPSQTWVVNWNQTKWSIMNLGLPEHELRRAAMILIANSEQNWHQWDQAHIQWRVRQRKWPSSVTCRRIERGVLRLMDHNWAKRGLRALVVRYTKVLE
jgi:hypothetical protein